MDDAISSQLDGGMMPERLRHSTFSTGVPIHDNDRSHITGIDLMPTYLEAASGARPYLPADDAASWHLSGATGQLDRQFRLLREEHLGPVRDACHEVLSAIQGQDLEYYKRQKTSTHFNFCDNAKVHCVTMDDKYDIEFTLAIRQPEAARRVNDDSERRFWWERYGRFRPGTLVCMLDRSGYIVHFVVSESTLCGPKVPGYNFPAFGSSLNLSSNREWAFVILKLVDSSKLGDALRSCMGTGRPRYLLDFPGMVLASFKYTLEALQRDYQSPHRLVSALSPGLLSSQSPHLVEKPLYARRPGFVYNLDCLMQDGHSFQYNPSSVPTPSGVSLFPGLEPDQAIALLKALSCEVAPVGGLPGPGKSPLVRRIVDVLLHSRESGRLGPVVCIFHSDDALDAMVYQLLAGGIENIVRMGGPTTSKRLQHLNLPVTTYTADHEQDRLAQEKMNKLLTSRLPRCRGRVLGPSDTGMYRGEKTAEENVREFLDKLVSDTKRLLSSLFGIPTTMDQELRDSVIDGTINDLTSTSDQYEEALADLQRFHDNARRQILQHADVVAVTGPQLARWPELLQPIHAKVVVIVDADEFHESQVLTALLPSAEHIILIGNKRAETEQPEASGSASVPSSSDNSFFKRLINATSSSFLTSSDDRCGGLRSELSLPCTANDCSLAATGREQAVEEDGDLLGAELVVSPQEEVVSPEEEVVSPEEEVVPPEEELLIDI